MKRIIIAGLLVLVMVSPAFALDITITIPNDKVTEFKTGFLAATPVPLDEAGQPMMGELAWFKNCVKRWMLRCYADGKRNIRNQIDPNIDDGVIE